eukprot:CAMPEP_0172180352 /NCGR_PEP_ID=MMETSP1050-20130122/17173_1 /TAXON_ID=233186 /ORGANISM="Cryptomonas curvata, Strain CCAP979/52" /LENGTH=67 /DNA_ID=CAMNT_0012853431 /DNA_START=59 /DNA_END=259 /DNA_ORIENTATION=+
MNATQVLRGTPQPQEPSTWIAGCVLFVLGSVIINFAQILIRQSHVYQQSGGGGGGGCCGPGPARWRV